MPFPWPSCAFGPQVVWYRQHRKGNGIFEDTFAEILDVGEIVSLAKQPGFAVFALMQEWCGHGFWTMVL